MSGSKERIKDIQPKSSRSSNLLTAAQYKAKADTIYEVADYIPDEEASKKVMHEAFNWYSASASFYKTGGDLDTAKKVYDLAEKAHNASLGAMGTEKYDAEASEYMHKQQTKLDRMTRLKSIFDRQNRGGIEKTVATTAVVGLVGGSFFLSSNVTGNVIGLSNTTSSWIGGVLILIGLIALGFWVKNRKKNNVVSRKKK